MENRYATLKKVYGLVDRRVHPTRCLCPLSAVLIHRGLPWDRLMEHLRQLALEELVALRQADTLQVSITESGIETISSLKKDPPALRGKSDAADQRQEYTLPPARDTHRYKGPPYSSPRVATQARRDLPR